jgi:alginate O-acetyltransferase complex protein AlgI
MVFSSTVFLFAFLPLVLAVYFASPRALRNLVLLVASLFFYAWGEVVFVAVMVASIGANYLFGLWIDSAKGGPRARLAVGLGVAANLSLLGWFKYANFVVDNLNALLGAAGMPLLDIGRVHLPIGISFFTFQALSYLVDLYRGQVEVQRRPLDLALYIALFPQLIAGPIVRYADLALELRERRTNVDEFSDGIRRFVVGLGKKLLVANTMSVPADAIFALAPDERGALVAWLGVTCYALQIYFDFSGYSDMAIGLGRMFGFHFRENFDYPYICTTIREFWQRWHISLSTWLRDYLYIPLGGNRTGPVRTYANLFSVFLLCGLWHGASWNFVLFGAFHGLFMVVERLGLERVIARLWAPLRYLYAQFALMLAWVIFRSETLPKALDYFAAMFGLGGARSPEPLALYLTPEVAIVLALGVFGSTPWIPALRRWLERRPRLAGGAAGVPVAAVELVAIVLIFAGSAMKLASETHNPFIYFRF